MTDEQTRDEVFDTMLAELVEAGYVEEYTDEDGQAAMRLTPAGEQVARQLAMVADDDAASMMAGLLGDEVEGGDDYGGLAQAGHARAVGR